MSMVQFHLAVLMHDDSHLKRAYLWAVDCIQLRGLILDSDGAHWCPDWDGLPVDSTTDEWPTEWSEKFNAYDALAAHIESSAFDETGDPVPGNVQPAHSCTCGYPLDKRVYMPDGKV